MPNVYNITNRQEYTAVGTTVWNVPTGVKRVWVTLVGGGGGGGGSSAVGYGSGGAGACIIYRKPIVIPEGVTTVSVTVGAGGAGGTTGGTNGSGGAPTSFGTYAAAAGGHGSAGTVGAGAYLRPALLSTGRPANHLALSVTSIGAASLFQPASAQRVSAGAPTAGTYGGGGGGGAYSASAATCGGSSWGPGGIGGYGTGVAQAGAAGGSGYAMIEW